METKHTPGPWKLESSDERGFSFDVLDANRCYIAQVLERGYTPETEANARLVACAPDLLSVLKEAGQLLGYFHWDSGEGRKDKFEMVQKIRAAIARAEGR